MLGRWIIEKQYQKDCYETLKKNKVNFDLLNYKISIRDKGVEIKIKVYKETDTKRITFIFSKYYTFLSMPTGKDVAKKIIDVLRNAELL